jgi:hypothetical protein
MYLAIHGQLSSAEAGVFAFFLFLRVDETVRQKVESAVQAAGREAPGRMWFI